MTKFTFNASNASEQYIQILAEFPVTADTIELQLPSWRPGRYELANFAQYIRHFKVCDANKQPLCFSKISKDRWKVEGIQTSTITVSYQFYATILNAGSTFLDENQLYVNPVNCCVYAPDSFDQPVEVSLEVPKDWDVAGSFEKTENGYTVESFDELFDTPFIASNSLQKESYESNGTTFHVWFNGEVKPDWSRLMKDFKRFTDKQIEKFTEFPVKEYHFINQILPYKTYHGVEHSKSTVISLGPSYAVFKELYKELLGVSSHELYHTWNVKAIRPIEMYPYDFSKENYSKMGFLCEGVTTYQGDLFLLKSGVFSEQQYFDEMNGQLQKHFDNHGRFNYSVAESSFDTWLDGYKVGAPRRKVSIYTEGCLLAFVTDIEIMRATENKYGLDEVMKRLYFNFALNNKGVSETDYKSVVEEVAGRKFDDFFENYIHGTRPYESILTEALDYVGMELNHKPSEKYSEGRVGMKLILSNKGQKIVSIYPGSPAELAGLMVGDEILGVNDLLCEENVDQWLNYFDDDQVELIVNRNGKIIKTILPEVNRNFYNTYSIAKIDSANNSQKKAFKTWIS